LREEIFPVANEFMEHPTPRQKIPGLFTPIELQEFDLRISSMKNRMASRR
jgi:hypothetical protein